MTTTKKTIIAAAALLLVPTLATTVLPMLLLMAPVALLLVPLLAGVLANGAFAAMPQTSEPSTVPQPTRERLAPIALPQPHQGWWPVLRESLD
jgi:UPF0716 family protein affecting phage T7 exclusion